MKTLICATLSITAAHALPASDSVSDALPAPVVDTDFHGEGVRDEAVVELGRLLFFDKVLSGNKNISCATCHHPELNSADGVSLGLGEGAQGLGDDRRTGRSLTEGVYERVPRNAPGLFNLGAKEFTRMFHDGRVEVDEHGYYESGFITPARWKFPVGLNHALAAQAMFPVTSPTEMSGNKGENEIADARSLNNVSGPNGVWELLARRLQSIPEYVERFRSAFPEAVKTADDITYVHAANAIAAFEVEAFRADRSPFDRHLRGEEALGEEARRGMELFYGKAGCHTCHAGKFQTDHDFHAIAMPQIGPGKSDGWNADYWRATGLKAFPEDFGRERVTAREEDRYKFRTPSLRNVELTGPWGHDGAYEDLEAVVRHHLDPESSLHEYEVRALPPIEAVVELVADGPRLSRAIMSADRAERYLRRDTWVQSHDELRGAIAEANELAPSELTDDEVGDLVAFLHSLTDTSRAPVVPERVPSGLPVSD